MSFRCKPGNHWRPCTDTVMATTPEEAARIIAATDYGMPIAGPYTPNAEIADKGSGKETMNET